MLRADTSPYIEAMLMIQPLSPDGNKSCLSICAEAYLQPRNRDLALTAIVESQSCSGVSCIFVGVRSISGQIPALFTKLCQAVLA